MRHLQLACILALLLSVVGCSAQPPGPQAPIEVPRLTVFLVRHAEKLDDGRDPGLSPAGERRAATLAHTLRDAQIERIHSSDYIRTRDTAAPIAAALGLDVGLYDPRDLPTLAAELRQTGGVHLVVGHSNTTPALVELLDGEPGDEIDEASEYERRYVLTRGRHGTTTSTLLRFGEAYVPGD